MGNKGTCGVDGLFMNQVTNAERMFDGAGDINLSTWRQSYYCTSADFMFINSGLTELNNVFMPSLDTSVSFCKNCKQLTTVTDLYVKSASDDMFMGCENLTSVDLTISDNPQNCYRMFAGCYNLTTAHINFGIQMDGVINIINASGMFEYCDELSNVLFETSANVYTGDYHACEEANSMFYLCSALETN
jgi:hypothetical protein